MSCSKHFNQLNSLILLEQISYLQILIVVKLTRLDQVIEKPDSLSNEEKIRLLNSETKKLLSDLISSFGSNYTASPIMLAWSTLLYSFSIDTSLNKGKFLFFYAFTGDNL